MALSRNPPRKILYFDDVLVSKRPVTYTILFMGYYKAIHCKVIDDETKWMKRTEIHFCILLLTFPDRFAR